MSEMKIVVDQRIPFVEEAFGAFGEILKYDSRAIDNAAVHDADALLVRSETKVDEKLVAGKGVNVNAIAPGYIATDNTKALREDPDRSRSILDRIPAGRWGTPEDLMGAVVFLCSDASSYINGSIITVDGGWMGR